MMSCGKFLALSPLKQHVVQHHRGKDVTERIPSVDITPAGHSLILFVWISSVLAYFIASIVLFVYRPSVESFSQVLSKKYGPVPIRIETQCSNPPNCGDIIVQTNYSSLNSGQTSCSGIPFNQVNTTTYQIGRGEYVDTWLCYTPDEMFTVHQQGPMAVSGISIDVQRPHPGIDPERNVSDVTMRAQGNVVISSPSNPDFKRIINLDSWQVKTLVLGLTVRNNPDDTEEKNLFSVAIQYDGKRPNWRATLMVRMVPYANVYSVTRPGSIPDILAQVGGAATFVSGILIALGPLWRLVFAPADDDVNETPLEKVEPPSQPTKDENGNLPVRLHATEPKML